jgi:hypothetical protein
VILLRQQNAKKGTGNFCFIWFLYLLQILEDVLFLNRKSGQISDGYPVPVSGFYNTRISGRPDIRPNQYRYPVRPYKVFTPVYPGWFFSDPGSRTFFYEIFLHLILVLFSFRLLPVRIAPETLILWRIWDFLKIWDLDPEWKTSRIRNTGRYHIVRNIAIPWAEKTAEHIKWT